MYGDEKTLQEVNNLIEKQASAASNGLDIYCILGITQIMDDWRIKQHPGVDITDSASTSEITSSTQHTATARLNLSNMPVPVFMHIMSFLDARDICNLGKTCFQFYAICQDQILWKKLLRSDQLKWSEIGYSTNPETYMDLHSDMSFKNIYLKCSPEIQRRDNFKLMRIPRLLRSYFSHRAPKIVMFGPGLDSDTSRIVCKILNGEENTVFKNEGPFPAMFPGSIGTGFKISVDDQHHMRLITLYSETKKSREQSPLEMRSERSRLLQKITRNEVNINIQQYQPTETIKLLCEHVDAFIFVVESSQGLKSVSGCREELHALMDLQWTPYTCPLLILSCTPTSSTARIPCVTISDQLHLNKLVRQWKAVDAVVSDLTGVTSGIKWLIETAQGKQ